MADPHVDSDVLLSSDHFKERCGIFYRNVDKFLEIYGTRVNIPANIKCWLVTLHDNNRLHVYVEPTCMANATCDQCRILGWGTHPVSTARYHFIVPAQSGSDSLADPSSLPAIAEAMSANLQQDVDGSVPGASNPVGLVRLPTNKKRNEAHISPYNAPSTIFDSARHSLHGVVHTNGFGHLLRVNGREGGGKYSGTQMVDLWDTLCKGLGVKKITVEDVSSKNGMELRVLYSIACGHTWYGGKWGFTYGRGPYNMTEYNWISAWRHVAAATLSNLLYDFEGLEPGVPAIVQRYRLPVRGAAKVRDLGTLFMRLLYLQARPNEARPFFDEKEIQTATETMRRLDEERCHSMVGRGRGRGRGRGKGRGLLSKTASQNRKGKGQVTTVIDDSTLREDHSPTIHALPSGPPLSGTRILWYCRTRSVWYQGRICGQNCTPDNHSSTKYVVDFGNDLFAELDLVNDDDVKFYDENERPSFLDNKKRKDSTFGWGFIKNKEPKVDMQMKRQSQVHIKPELDVKLQGTEIEPSPSSVPAARTRMKKSGKVLRYKAHLSRPQDNIERARQLSRALKSLFPGAKEYLGQGKTRKELDLAFDALVGNGVPKPTYRGEWWEYLSTILQWASSVTDGSQGNVGGAIRNDGNVIEIDVDALHDLGLYPETWPIPLTPEGVRSSNLQATGQEADGLRNWEPRIEVGMNDTGGITGVSTCITKITDADAPDTEPRLKLPDNMPVIHLGCRRCRKPKMGCRECRARELEKLKESGVEELVAIIGAGSCCGTPHAGCPKCWRRAFSAMGLSQGSIEGPAGRASQVGTKRPSRPTAKAEHADAERHVRRKIWKGQKIDHKTYKTTPKALLDPAKIRDLVQEPPGPDQLPESALTLPLTAVLIDSNLPTLTIPHCSVEEPLRAAMSALCSAAASHKDVWLSPLRLIQMAERSLAMSSVVVDPGIKEQAVPLIQTALAHLGETQYRGWAFRRVNHPHGGVMYLSRPVPQAVAPRPLYRSLCRPEAQQEAIDAALSCVVFALPTPPPLLLHPPPISPQPSRPWTSRAPGGDLPQNSPSDADVKIQVTRDLQYLFMTVIRTYAPAIAKVAAENAAISMGQRAATRVLKLRQLPEEVVILRDTKHFVKVYSGGGDLTTSKEDEDENKNNSSLVTLSCRLSLPPRLTDPPVPNLTRFGRKFIPVEPPPELITMHEDATIGEFLNTVTETYRSIYHMCLKFVAVDIISAGIQGKSQTVASPHRNATLKQLVHDCSALQTLKTGGIDSGSAKVSSPVKPSGSSIAVPITVTIAGVDLDLSTPEWMHAGGPEDWIVACSCGTRDDDGEAMLSCDVCGVWWHTRCARAPTEDGEESASIATWVCPSCAKKHLLV